MVRHSLPSRIPEAHEGAIVDHAGARVTGDGGKDLALLVGRKRVGPVNVEPCERFDPTLEVQAIQARQGLERIALLLEVAHHPVEVGPDIGLDVNQSRTGEVQRWQRPILSVPFHPHSHLHQCDKHERGRGSCTPRIHAPGSAEPGE